MWSVEQLVKFEDEINEEFMAGNCKGPVHLSSMEQAEHLIPIFKNVSSQDWVFSTWRSHFHALLKGIPEKEVKRQILDGRSMSIMSPDHRFFSSAIMAGCLPIACGVAQAGHRCWVFVGDMCASIGAFADAQRFAYDRGLNIRFVIEDNGLSTNTPTSAAWGHACRRETHTQRYSYSRTWPHYQSAKGTGF